MIVYVRFNSSHGFPVELEQGASVSELKETVGRLQSVQPDRLRVIFAGRELCNESTLQGCDLPEQSTVHVVLPPSTSTQHSELVQEQRMEGGMESLTRLDLSGSRLTNASEGLAVILETNASRQGNSIGRTEAKAHSSFYVFCKTVCKAIQPGKLRVRCKDCKQGTLTLSRGPCCWDDVLFPNRIHGVCQSQDCEGRMAEFYLKCAAHPTCDNDSSAALDLIMPNTRRVPCIACTDIIKFVFCRNCKAEYHEGPCRQRTDTATGSALQGYIVDEEAALRARWEQASQETIAEITRPCPRCQVPVEKSGGCMHMVCPRPQCKFEWCWLCCVEWNRECMGNHWFG
ncbi:E3 ubiquitin-protein ligase parkin-like [Garra rufa]|uniref:E3 ubiquitin-protein ligase parkin-like n=1 Tax=Garra rufa TaxID=137080 RepID=UPI003CCE939B